MATTKRKVQTPGQAPEIVLPPPPEAGDVDDGGEAQRLARLEADNVQLRAVLQQLIERGTMVPAEADAPVKAAKLIGEDVRPMTSAQVLAAVAAGTMARPDRTVMCADGYLAPLT